MPYNRKPIKAPIVSGTPLRALAWLLERPLLGAPVRAKLMRDAGVTDLREIAVDQANSLMPELRHFKPTGRGDALPAVELAAVAAQLPARSPGGWRPRTITDYADAYRSGATTPTEVAERLIAAVAESNAGSQPLRAIIAIDESDVRRQAAESAARFADGKPLSVLDGVPVAVKDEVDMVPYPTTVGTSFLGTSPARRDATTVARLRAAGALLFGKANMHELGIGVTGHNPHHGTCRNPYDPTRHTGGSSSGPAAAVAAGLCPLALGADGGGSIRTPAALCGDVGLKATFGRVSEHGAAPLCWSVAHIGPIAATARDAAIGYAIMAGPDEHDAGTQDQPAPDLMGLGDVDLSGVTIGIHRPWFQDARPDVVAKCDDVVEALRAAGATVRDIELDYIDEIRLAHLVTIASEMVAGQLFNDREHRHDYGLDVRINFALARAFAALDYAHAQRVRRAGFEAFMAALDSVDVIVTPSTGCTAPAIPEHAMPGGESNLELLSEIMRFAPQGNLLGLPAISFPAGYDANGLPVGFQAMGRPWSEALLLRLAYVAEGTVARREPAVSYTVLD